MSGVVGLPVSSHVVILSKCARECALVPPLPMVVKTATVQLEKERAVMCYTVQSVGHYQLDFKHCGFNVLCAVAIDGGWTHWGCWGSCSSTCGDVGRQSRSRTCTNPAPRYNGSSCAGSMTDSQPCLPEVSCAPGTTSFLYNSEKMIDLFLLREAMVCMGTVVRLRCNLWSAYHSQENANVREFWRGHRWPFLPR